MNSEDIHRLLLAALYEFPITNVKSHVLMGSGDGKKSLVKARY